MMMDMKTGASEMSVFSDEERAKARRVYQRLHPDYLTFRQANRVDGNRFSADAKSCLTALQKKEGTAQENDSFMLERDDMEGFDNLLTVDVLPESGIPVLGSLICLIKRFHRKMLFWYLKPVLERQSLINMEYTAEINRLLQENRRLRDMIYFGTDDYS